MSTPEYTSSGGTSRQPAELIVVRWGGGAHHGKYHVFTAGTGYGFAAISRQCVMDDFGTLVPVGAS